LLRDFWKGFMARRSASKKSDLQAKPAFTALSKAAASNAPLHAD
jgi:hypothetical protein